MTEGRRPGGYEDALASADPLVCFLYLLGRDALPLGQIEALVSKSTADPQMRQFSNDFLAAYAIELAARLKGAMPEAALRDARALLAITDDLRPTGEPPC